MKIQYYYALSSPFAYLGSLKFQSIAKKYNVETIEKPCDLVCGIFAKTGGIPFPQRSAQRQKYRLGEIRRWSIFLNIKTNIKPKFFPQKDPHISAKSEKVSKIYADNTEEAVEKNVFGSPTYIFNNELFWGQDRLEFLERALKNA